MASASEPSANESTTACFVKKAASKFGWGDLSDDVLMDIGCGSGLYCAKAVLENFPKIKTIIALDGDPAELDQITFKSPKITTVRADLLNRNDIRQYEGKIDKAIGTHVLHQIPEKENVFKNIYRLLKPGGQAAFLFTLDYTVYHVLEHLRLDSRYKDYYKGGGVMNLYSRQLKSNHYEEMLQKTGFQVVEISEEKEHIPIQLFKNFEVVLHRTVSKVFSAPSQLLDEMYKSASQFFHTKFCDQMSIWTGTEISIFVIKPVDSTTACSNS